MNDTDYKSEVTYHSHPYITCPVCGEEFEVRTEIQEAIKPKPVFVKGELIEVRDSEIEVWDVTKFDHLVSDGRTIDHFQYGHKFSRKLDSIPFAPIAHDSADMPEGLKDDDDILRHYNQCIPDFFCTQKAGYINWSEVDKWVKVHFVGSDNETK